MKAQEVAPTLLSAVLAVLGVAKIASGYDVDFWVSEPIFYTLSILELGLAALLFTRFRETAAIIVIGICIIGGAIALTNRDTPCGCLGSVLVLSWRAHLILCGVVGLFAALFVWKPRIRSAPASPRMLLVLGVFLCGSVAAGQTRERVVSKTAELLSLLERKATRSDALDQLEEKGVSCLPGVLDVLHQRIRNGQPIASIAAVFERFGPDAAPYMDRFYELTTTGKPIMEDVVACIRASSAMIPFAKSGRGRSFLRQMLREIKSRKEEVARLPLALQMIASNEISRGMERSDVDVYGATLGELETLLMMKKERKPNLRVVAAQAIARRQGLQREQKIHLLGKALRKARNSPPIKWIAKGGAWDRFEVILAGEICQMAKHDDGPTVELALSVLLERHERARVRTHAARRLGLFNGPTGLHALCVAVRDREHLVAIAGIRALVERARRPAVRPSVESKRWLLIELLYAESSDIREAAAQALRELGRL